jgi:hypothetical protein
MAGTNTNNPDLSLWITGFKASLILRGFAYAGRNFTGIDFKSSCFEVDRHNLAMITRFNLRSDL